MKNNESISKFLSLILRHDPGLIHLDMDNNGWVSIDQIIINAKKFKNIDLSIAIIKDIVSSNDKKRFIIDDASHKIRANQGHSVKVDLELESKIPPNKLYHGTATRFLESIKLNGLKPMSRNHVHLSSTIEVAHEVGKRHGKPIILEINAQKMYEQGSKFYLSENEVWLCDHVLPEFIKILS